MKSKTGGKKRGKVGQPREPERPTDEVTGQEAMPAQVDVDSDEDDPDEAELRQADDGLWDGFILDDDEGDPLPEYGDFWFPD